ncbi:MAG: hypothetical protein AABY84_11275, partial [Candidatus Firestonebacteria bacterium]
MNIWLFICAIFVTNICSGNEIKWHPGHYILVADDTSQKNFIHPKFLGIQKRYYWNNLEPKKDVYDFSEIKSDLFYLEKYEKRLVVQIQTKSFKKDITYAPDYLRGPEYGGGIFKSDTGAFNPVYWNTEVSKRLNALYTNLGRELDKEPYLEAVVLPETALGYIVPKIGVESYNVDKYIVSLKSGMKALKDAFPNTVVIQYTNFPLDDLEELTNYEKEIGVGLGGPDVAPYSPSLTNIKKGIYRFYPKLSGIIPLGAAVQYPDYTWKKTEKTPKELRDDYIWKTGEEVS